MNSIGIWSIIFFLHLFCDNELRLASAVNSSTWCILTRICTLIVNEVWKLLELFGRHYQIQLYIKSWNVWKQLICPMWTSLIDSFSLFAGFWTISRFIGQFSRAVESTQRCCRSFLPVCYLCRTFSPLNGTSSAAGCCWLLQGLVFFLRRALQPSGQARSQLMIENGEKRYTVAVYSLHPKK